MRSELFTYIQIYKCYIFVYIKERRGRCQEFLENCEGIAQVLHWSHLRVFTVDLA